jgi:hypothetical protein
MIEREYCIGKIVEIRGGSIVVKLDDGCEIPLGSRAIRDLHRKFGFFAMPIGQKVKISRDVHTQKRRAVIVEIIRE